jgi:hypothetical protein
MTVFYKLFVIGAVGLYAAAGFLGWDFASAQKRPLPSSVRQSPGGYRSFHFWHTGIHGGK